MEQTESVAIVPFFICHRSESYELYLCAGALFASKIQQWPDSLCPLPYPGTPGFQNTGVNSLAIITNTQLRARTN
jgi:hypothetical protein